VLAAKQRYFSSLLTAAPRVVPRPGAGEVLDRLVRRGVPVAVGTVTERDAALGILERAGLLPLVGADRVVTAADVPRLKPAPDVYLETARRLGRSPADQLVFEDSVTGIRAARSAGCPVVAMPTGSGREYRRSISAAGVVAVCSTWHDPGLPPLLDRLLAPAERVQVPSVGQPWRPGSVARADDWSNSLRGGRGRRRRARPRGRAGSPKPGLRSPAAAPVRVRAGPGRPGSGLRPPPPRAQARRALLLRHVRRRCGPGRRVLRPGRAPRGRRGARCRSSSGPRAGAQVPLRLAGAQLVV